MKLKKSISLVLSAVITLLAIMPLSGCGEKIPSTVLGATGEKLAEIISSVSGKATYTNEKYFAYIDFVIGIGYSANLNIIFIISFITDFVIFVIVYIHYIIVYKRVIIYFINII